MSTDLDLEQELRRELSTAATPPELTLDAAGMTQLASGAHRRRRAGQVVGAGVASLALVGTLAWAGGALPTSVERALPASPWVCAVTGWNGESPRIDLGLLDEVRVPVTGGTVVAGVTEGCPFEAYVTGATTPDAGSDDATVAMSGGLGVEDSMGVTAVSGFGDIPVGDSVVMGITLSPGGVRDLQVVGPDAVHRPSQDPVRVPGSSADFAVVEGVRTGDALAVVYRGADGLVRTAFGLGQDGVTPRAFTPQDGPVDTWVAQGIDGDLWAMHRGEVRGPLAVGTEPVALALPDPARSDRVDVIVIPPSRGDVVVDGGEVGPRTWLDTNPEADEVGLAALVTTVRVEDEGSWTLTWQPEDGDPQPVQLVD